MFGDLVIPALNKSPVDVTAEQLTRVNRFMDSVGFSRRVRQGLSDKLAKSHILPGQPFGRPGQRSADGHRGYLVVEPEAAAGEEVDLNCRLDERLAVRVEDDMFSGGDASALYTFSIHQSQVSPRHYDES